MTPIADSERSTSLLRGAAILAMIASVVVVALHAARDRINAFPDELLHSLTASYYLDHWWPPAFSEALAPYAAVHGMSYHMLWPPQATYPLFSKASLLVSPLGDVSRVYFYRGLCVALWVGLLAQVLPNLKRSPWLFWLVGLTPAVWYVYSYFNADALSYCVAATLVVQLGVPDSVGRRFLASGKPLLGGVVLGAGVGLLALSKLNYLTFSATAFAYCLLLLWRHRDVAGYLKRGIAVLCIACAVAGPYLTIELALNGHEREAHYETLREKFAGPGFHASDITNGTAYYGYALRDRGIKAGALFHRPWRWGLLTSRSFYGIYGTMDVARLPWLNDAQFYLGLLIIVVGFWSRRRDLTRKQLLFAGVAVTMCFVAIGAAFWRAWTEDFQAQGRYCFAIIPIAVLVMLELCDDRPRLAHWALAVVMSCAGLLSLMSALPYLA